MKDYEIYFLRYFRVLPWPLFSAFDCIQYGFGNGLDIGVAERSDRRFSDILRSRSLPFETRIGQSEPLFNIE